MQIRALFTNREFFLPFQEYSVQVTFREQWYDERLRYIEDTQGIKHI